MLIAGVARSTTRSADVTRVLVAGVARAAAEHELAAEQDAASRDQAVRSAHGLRSGRGEQPPNPGKPPHSMSCLTALLSLPHNAPCAGL